MSPSFRFGIEEELFLADAVTRDAPKGVKGFHDDVHARMPEVERELLSSQVEIMTEPCTDIGSARTTLADLRAGLADIGRDHGVLVFAAGTRFFLVCR